MDSKLTFVAESLHVSFGPSTRLGKGRYLHIAAVGRDRSESLLSALWCCRVPKILRVSRLQRTATNSALLTLLHNAANGRLAPFMSNETPPKENTCFAPALLILGENAAGKSTTLEAIALALNVRYLRLILQAKVAN